jgi:hypothetical protein
MAARSAVQRARDLVVERVGERAWCLGVGIGREEGAPCVVISVRPGSRAAARRSLRPLGLEVPVRIRESGPVRARREGR